MRIFTDRASTILICCFLLQIGRSDWKERHIVRQSLLFLAAAAFFRSSLREMLPSALAGCLAGVLILLPARLLMPRSLGKGDLYLAGGIGLAAGPRCLCDVLLLSLLASLVWWVLRKMRGDFPSSGHSRTKPSGSQSELVAATIPLGTFFAGGTILFELVSLIE